jgi:antitoxin YefM
MKTLTISQARAELYRLLDEAAETHEPIQITGRRHKAVLIAEEDWRAIQETLHLLSVPEMRESILKSMAMPLDECADEPGW